MQDRTLNIQLGTVSKIQARSKIAMGTGEASGKKKKRSWVRMRYDI